MQENVPASNRYRYLLILVSSSSLQVVQGERVAVRKSYDLAKSSSNRPILVLK